MNILRNLDKGILGESDSPELWERILSEQEVFNKCSSADNILIVAGGHGTEVDVLVELHGEDIVKKIWFNDQFICFTNEVLLKYPNINIVEGDFTTLKLGTKNMMFDVIIGNPPYQDGSNKAKNNKLWHKFVKEADTLLKNDGILSFVTPNSIFIQYVGFGKWFCEDMMGRYSLLVAELHEPKQYFDVGVGTCHWSVRKINKPHVVEIPSLRDGIIGDILDKVSAHPKKLELVHENPSLTTKDFDQGTYEIYYSGKNKTNVINRPINPGTLKIVFPFSAKYENQFVTTEATAHFNRVLYVKDQTEANNVMSYTKSKLIRFFAAFYLKTAGFTPAVKKNQLPDLGRDKIWTDEQLFSEFKLTPEEIEYVNEKIK